MSELPPRRPRILVVTPEITYLPDGMGNLAQRMCAKAGGLADVSASLVKALYDQGADVHVALPNYRRMFHLDVASVFAVRRFSSLIMISPLEVFTTTRSPRRIGVPGETTMMSPSR